MITILKSFKPSEIPAESEIISEGIQLMSSTSSWVKGRTYFGHVQTLYRAKGAGDGAPWHCRISEHPKDEIDFDDLWLKLSVNKAANEKNFIHEIHKVTKVKEVSPTATISTFHYKFTPPISPRVFTILQVVHLSEEERRTGIIVSLNIDLSSPGDESLAILEEKGVRGYYVSVERLQELDNGNTEWRMATSSTPGGSIPSFIVESTMPKQIASDVPKFMNWYRSLSK